MVKHESVAEIERGVAAVEVGVRNVEAIAITGGSAIRAGGVAVPIRTPVDRMAPGVISIERQPVAHFLGYAELQGVIDGIDGVLPEA